jgi:DeoR family transcriptional regulator, aga operon transcriptional repressor
MDNTQALRRQERIVRLLAGRDQATVKELADALGVSGWTVRRDLDQLEQRRVVKRHHGGAELNTTHGYEGILAPAATVAADVVQIAAKRRIAQAAADLIAPGQHVAIGAGTTTNQVAQSLRGRSQLRVVTNGLNVALVLGSEPGIRVTCTGGDVDVDYLTLTGPVAERSLRGHFFDVAVIGVSGITAREGLTATSPLNAVCLGMMIEHSAKTIVVADQTKFGRVCFASLAPLDAVDVLVTDVEPAPELMEALKSGAVRVVVV